MIVIVDYGMGNLNSVLKAFKRINVEAIVSSNINEIEKADKLILPGVGHFKKAMENLDEMDLIKVLNKKVLEEKTPILGICLGIQLFTKSSEEGDSKGLGWIDAETIRLNEKDGFKLPHIGWGGINLKKQNKLFFGINLDALFYFVHSFHVKCNKDEDILAETDYSQKFTSSIQKENIFGVQFHPEKSHKEGLKLLKNFAEL